MAFLCLYLTVFAQNDLQKQRLQETVEHFFRVYNTGDSAAYYKLLEQAMPDKAQRTETLNRYIFSYGIIGKVEVKKIDILSPQQADIWAKDLRFDSWWKFSVITDSMQQFRKRMVKPERFTAAFLKENIPGPAQFSNEIDAYITGKLQTNFSGNVFVSHKGQTIFSKSYGNNASGDPNTYDQDFGLASMGKMFTAISILQLQERKRLSLQDTVGKFLPELKNKSLAPITIKQLLTHTSGMGDFFESPIYNKIKDRITKTADFLPVIEEEKLAFEPGKGWQYSNSGFSLLGLIIEKISGIPYESYVQKNVFTPAFMLHSTPGGGAGGGRSTVGDLLHFSNALLNYRLLGKETTNDLLQFTVNDQYGMGTEHYRLGNEHIVGHSGGFIRECTEFNIYTKGAYTVIILSNSNPPFGHFIADKIKELLIPKS